MTRYVAVYLGALVFFAAACRPCRSERRRGFLQGRVGTFSLQTKRNATGEPRDPRGA